VKRTEKPEIEIIPEEVDNIEAYRAWEALKVEIEDQKWYEHPNLEEELNLCAIQSKARYKWEHLSQEDQDEISIMYQNMRKKVANLGVLKRKAFNLHRGNGRSSLTVIMGKEKEAELLELFGAFHTVEDVHRVVLQDWGFDVSFSLINSFRNKNIDKILQKQEDFKRDFSHLRLTHKRSRIEELTWMYEVRKSKYEQNNNSREDEKLLKQTIEQIKREVEGDKVVIDGKIELDIKQTLNLHTQKEIMGRLNLLTIVVSRIAAQVNINPIWIMTKLVNSYYSKFSGMQKPDNNIMSDEIMYPNNIVYNFDDIESMHENMKLEQLPLKVLHTEVEPDDKQKAHEAKHRLKKLLDKKRNQIEESRIKTEAIIPSDKKINKHVETSTAKKVAKNKKKSEIRGKVIEKGLKKSPAAKRKKDNNDDKESK